MKIALFGGAFDPPHIGHKIVADSLIANKIVDAVWFVPVFKHPWADRYGKHELAKYEDRVAMLELTINSISNTGVDNRANNAVISGAKKQKVAHYKAVSFTYDTLEYFSKKHPEHEFSWVMGSEYLGRFDDFLKGHPKLLGFTFYVYPRSGFVLAESLQKKNMIFLSGMQEIAASSTEIKKRIAARTPLAGLVVDGVEQFIIENGLYGAL